MTSAVLVEQELFIGHLQQSRIEPTAQHKIIGLQGDFRRFGVFLEVPYR